MYILVDEVEEGFRPVWDLQVWWQVEFSHVVRAVALLPDETFTCRPESLDRVAFAFLHLLVGLGLHTRHRFPSMDFIRINRVPIQISHNLHRVHLSPDLNLVGFHCLLDGGSDLT